MTAWVFWTIVALAGVALAAVPVCAWLEDRACRRDSEAWAKQPGAVQR